MNKKTGPIPVSTSSAKTCPHSCPLRKHGCYAETGPLALWWRRVTKGMTGTNWNAFCLQIKGLARGTFWRHNQAGDLPGENEVIDKKMLRQLVEANKGRMGFTYTHKTNRKANLPLIKEANQNGFTINLSANNLEHADKLHALGIAPVVCVLPSSVDGSKTKTVETPKGRKVVICPATYMNQVSCLTCKLCARADRSVIVGFPAHGCRSAMASAVAS